MIQQNNEVVTLVLGVAALVFVRLYYSQIRKLPCACVVVAALCVSVVEERERRRLGGILHDKVSQLLMTAKMKLEAIRERIADECVRTGLDEVGDSLHRAIDDARTLTSDMSYPILYELGFEAAVAEWLADEVEGKGRLQSRTDGTA
jgi:signal transduction histidine kinase